MKYFFVSICLFTIISNISSQSTFVISGTTNFINNGKAILHHEAIETFFIIQKIDTVPVANYHFNFQGLIQYPLQFRISVIDGITGERYMSEPFFIDTGYQEILMNTETKVNRVFDFGYGVSVNGSITNDEYINKYLPLFNNVNEKTNILFSEMNKASSIKDYTIKNRTMEALQLQHNKLRETRDSILHAYAIQHPQSAIIPWELYDFLRRYGYKEKYQKIYERIAYYTPYNIKQSLLAYIDKKKVVVVGNNFPLINFIGSINNKYTLIEFWFSQCSPCIRQFNELKNIYAMYRAKGFDIIAISIDDKETIPIYKQILKEKEYPWKQLLDTGGVKSASLDIHTFPSSFLLDRNNKIIQINIKPYDLDIFLKNKLSE